jgi:UDP-3-O-[3-hydroxymyristoyl] glucosamine N-acyltransferase
VHIGRHTAMAGCSAVAGSTRIGAHCTIAGAASIVGHLQLADNVHVSTNTVVTHSIARPGQYTGVFPMDENSKWEKNAATLRQLYKLRERIKALEQARQGDQSATQQ